MRELTEQDKHFAKLFGDTEEEYRRRTYLERDLVEAEAQEILDNTNDIANVIDYVLTRVAEVYGTFNNGCSCCKTADLKEVLDTF